MKKWESKTLNVSELQLDAINPRVPDEETSVLKGGDKESISYLMDHAGVYALGQKIIETAGLPSLERIVIMGKKAPYVVLEGNRRVAAIKCILNPKLAPASYQKRFEKLNIAMKKPKDYGIEALISPDRESAMPLLKNKHVGSPIKPWTTKMQGNFARRYASVSPALSAKDKVRISQTNLYDAVLKLPLTKEQKDAVQDIKKFPITTFYRAAHGTVGKEFIGYKTDDAGEIIPDSKKEFQSRLKLVTLSILDGSIHSRLNSSAIAKVLSAKLPKEVAPADKKAYLTEKDDTPTTIPPTSTTPKEVFITPILKRRRSSVQYTAPESQNIVDHILCHFDAVAEQIVRRHAGRGTLVITDEHDVQDLLHSLLALFFDDIAREEWNPSHGATPSRNDFLLMDNGTIIEVKATHTKTGSNIAKNLQAELNDDLVKYSQRPDCKCIYLFVYDPDKKIADPRGFERAISGVKLQNIKVVTVVNRG